MSLVSTARRSASTADIRVGSYTDLAAEYYDASRHPTCANFREASALFLAVELAAVYSTDQHIVEIGAGRSLAAEFLPSAALRQHRLTLIDASCEMLAHSADWLAAGAMGIAADARHLPVADGCFELVVAMLGDPFNDQPFWNEVARVLRPGGVCLFTAPAFAWVQAFRAVGNGPHMDLAEFLTTDGSTLALPSFIPSPDQQLKMIETAGLVILRQRSITLCEIHLTPWSPKLLPSRGPDAAVVDAYVIGTVDKSPYL